MGIRGGGRRSGAAAPVAGTGTVTTAARSTAVAVTAGFGWLLSGALFAGLSRFSPLPASLARMVVPETVTASSWSTAMPWRVMVPLLSALTLFGLVQLMVGLFVPRTAPDHPGNRAVTGAVWLCVVLASFLTSALWSAGSILAQW